MPKSLEMPMITEIAQRIFEVYPTVNASKGALRREFSKTLLTAPKQGQAQMFTLN
jgi:hypothetical protein